MEKNLCGENLCGEKMTNMRSAPPSIFGKSCFVISNFCAWQIWRNLKFLHMWINFTFRHMTDVEMSKIHPHVDWFQISSHDRCREIWNLLHFVYNLWYFVAFYIVLLENFFFFFCRFTLFCRKIGFCDLRAFVWRKI